MSLPLIPSGGERCFRQSVATRNLIKMDRDFSHTFEMTALGQHLCYFLILLSIFGSSLDKTFKRD